MEETITIDNQYHPSLKDFESICIGKVNIRLSNTKEFVEWIEKGHQIIRETIKRNIPIYGVNTGFGDSCKNQIAYERVKELQANLIRFHGCGVGDNFSVMESTGVLLLRLVSNAKGYSGIRHVLLKQMELFITRGIIPLIPERGSVGASGDLTPLSYLAATLSGDRKVYYKGEIVEAKEALEKEKLPPLVFEAKEALAVLNGTSVMTAIAAFAVIRAKRIMRLSELTTCLTVEVLKGNKGSFSRLIHQIKPFKGQIKTAETIYQYLSDSKIANTQNEIINMAKENQQAQMDSIQLGQSIQDRYSLRCSPQIIGVLRDTLDWVEDWVTTEMNSVNDNPLIDPETGRIYKGGNFYGGHICQSMDSLRSALCNIADLMDRQVELVIDEKFNNGLSPNLISTKGDHLYIRHGFKALQITATALTVEIISRSNPISVLSRPTESLNQDKVSLGTISARTTRDVIKMTEQVLAIQILALCQAMDLRGLEEFSSIAKDVHKLVRDKIPFLDEDRPMDQDIYQIVDMMEQKAFDRIMD
ncbi:MAG: histidine ammonia-lyase [bacterium]|nr:MAG: histidine ammonia-lyase [bacterium]